MMKSNAYFTLFLLILLSFSCEESATPTLKSTDLVSDVKVVDFENNGNAGDLIVLFSVDNPGEASEVQLFLSKTPDLSTIDKAAVDNIAASSIMTIALSGNDYEVSLPTSLLDIEGNPIETETEYSLGIIVVSNGEKLLNSEQGTTSLTNGHYLSGDYQGFWSDQLFQNIAVSTKIQMGLVGNKAGGDFFYRANFLSCCEGENDGQINFTVNADGSLSDFSYRQDVVNYNGGPCDGLYTGEGFINKYTTLEFTFTGTDCDGDHGNGTLTLKKE